MLVRDVSHAKQLAVRLDTLEGSWMEVRDVQYANAIDSIADRLFPDEKVTDARDEQYEKQLSSRDVADPEIVTLWRREQPMNAILQILVTQDGIVRLVNPQFLNAAAPSS